MVCSKDEVMISIPRINESTSPTSPTSPVKDKQATNNTATATAASNSNADIGNESTPLLDHKKDRGDHTTYVEPPADDEEHITFAYIPMPGLWKEDKPGKNTDRIIILLFVLLASMTVVSIGSCMTYIHIIICKIIIIIYYSAHVQLYGISCCLQGIFAVSYNVAHRHGKNGVYVEVDVLDGVLNYGQVCMHLSYTMSWMISLLILTKIKDYTEDSAIEKKV